MTIKEARTITENSEEILWGGDRIYAGLTLLRKYYANGEYSFAHNQMWVSHVSFEGYVKVMSEEDVTSMAKLGWFESENYWSHL